MANPIYRFLLNGNLARPIYKDDIAKEYDLESNQQFYRAKLSGKLTFLRNDFAYIMAQPFETVFNVLIERSVDQGQTWLFEYEGKFVKTDCAISEDDLKLSVQLDTLDEYIDVLAGLEKEYNLINFPLEVEKVTLYKRPLIQAYIPGDSIISCFLGGSFWEQDVNATDDENLLVDKYHFALANMLKEINLTVPSIPFASGLYTGRLVVQTIEGGKEMNGTLRSAAVTGYRIDVRQGIAFPGWMDVNTIQVAFVRESDNKVLYFFEGLSQDEKYNNLDFTMNAQNGAIGTAQAEMATYRLYTRYILDADTILGLNTYPIPADDLVDNNRNYRRVIGYALEVGYISQNLSSQPTKWGRADNGKYFLPPYTPWNQTFFPIARSTWRYASIWFSFYLLDNISETAGRKRYVLPDAYPIHSVINTLLSQFAPNITFQNTPLFSEFLYSAQNPISYQRFNLLVTPKSNILAGSYTQPAQKASATLGQFLNMLRDVFRCYWHIENGKLRIEHISWYMNGGSYTGIQIIGIDLTKMLNTRNSKNWAFSTSDYTYDKPDMAERYEFSWMDDVTEVFEGFPIEVKSNYVTPGKKEEITISNFTSDVDMMMLNPSGMSNDGFALLATTGVNSLITPDNPNTTPVFDPDENEQPPVNPDNPTEPIDPEEPEEPPVILPALLRNHFPYTMGSTLKDNWKTRTTNYFIALADYGRVGAENAAKFSRIQSEEGIFNFDAIDEILDYCEENGLTFFFHCLIWADVWPKWFRNKKGIWTAAQFEACVRNHIRTVIEHLRPRMHLIDGFDALNEACGTSRMRIDTNEYREDGSKNTHYSFLGSVLPDFAAIVFDECNSLNIGKPCFINDFILEQSPGKCSVVIKLISDLAARGITIDGIGSQTHMPVGLNMNSFESRFRSLASTGKLIHISELDIKLKNGVSTANGWPQNISGWSTSDKTRTIETTILKARPELENLNTFIYPEVHRRYCRAVPQAQRFGVTTWSVGDRDSHLNYPDYTDFPLIYYYDYSAKPARAAMLSMDIPQYVSN